MSDAALLAAFESCTLPKSEWTHEAHVRTAWIYLTTRSYEEALAALRTGIPKYNRSLGNTTGYHDTVTVAFVRIIAARILASPDDDFPEFRSRHADLFTKTPSPLNRYYSNERLSSPEAVVSFVEPDLSPLP
jgi:hypothetical protein